jgi:hypothetical protein
MSLNWNARDCGNSWYDLDSATRDSLIFATYAVDMGEITERNFVQFYHRYVMWNIALGYRDVFLKETDVEAAIGLKTNVITTTDAAFKKSLLLRINLTATDIVRRQQ